MSEGLAAQISSIVRQHLADAHRMLGAMLARLDAGGEGDLGGRADWPALRQAIRAHIADRGISHERAAAEIGEVKRGTFSTWLSRDVPAPSERSVSRMRRAPPVRRAYTSPRRMAHKGRSAFQPSKTRWRNAP
jgi:hypothetical protein